MAVVAGTSANINHSNSSVNGARHSIASGSVATAYNFLKQIGQGSFGKIYLAERSDGGIFAIKKVGRRGDLNIATEIKVLKHLTNVPYVVQIHDVVLDATDVHIVLEYICGGDMYNFVNTFGKVSMAQARIWTSEMACALNRLHDMDILYGDLKIENVMIDVRGHIKLTDFGLSSILTPPYRAYKISGTFHYMAPEIFSTEDYANRPGYSFEADWWALGILLYEMLSGEQLYDISYRNQECGHVREKLMVRIYLRNIEEKIGDEQAADFIYRLNEKDPRSRLGRNFNDVKNHPFFKSVIWMDVAQYRGPVIYTPTLDNPNDTRYFEAQYTERTVSHETLAASRTSIHSSLIIEDVPMTRIIKTERIDLTASRSEEEENDGHPDEVHSMGSEHSAAETAQQQETIDTPSQVRQRTYAIDDHTHVPTKQPLVPDPSNNRDADVIQMDIELAPVETRSQCTSTTPSVAEQQPPESSNNRSVLFSAAKFRGTDSAPLFIKTSSGKAGGAKLKAFHNGAFIQLDEQKCLQWMTRNMAALVKASAVMKHSGQAHADRTERRSGRIARMNKINYKEDYLPRRVKHG